MVYKFKNKVKKTKQHNLIRMANDPIPKLLVYWQLSSSLIVDDADQEQWNKVTINNLNSIM